MPKGYPLSLPLTLKGIPLKRYTQKKKKITEKKTALLCENYLKNIVVFLFCSFSAYLL